MRHIATAVEQMFEHIDVYDKFYRLDMRIPHPRYDMFLRARHRPDASSAQEYFKMILKVVPKEEQESSTDGEGSETLAESDEEETQSNGVFSENEYSQW